MAGMTLTARAPGPRDGPGVVLSSWTAEKNRNISSFEEMGKLHCTFVVFRSK